MNTNKRQTQKQTFTKKPENGQSYSKNYNKQKINKKYWDKNFSQKEGSQEIKIIGHCPICSTGVSDQVHALVNEDQYIHFECALKKLKEITFTKYPQNKKNKFSYIGTNTFAIYTEKDYKSSWTILEKITLKEILK